MFPSRKICIVTGTRAEYGLLSGLMRQIDTDQDLELQTIVTGTHLSEVHGMTCSEIEKDGFPISWKVPMQMEHTSTSDVIKSMGTAMIGFADALAALTPDILVLLGDRYEILAAANAALISTIPIAHIHGGEKTIGAFDDAIRHAITKMSHLHFTSTEEYRHRVIQLGENPEHVFYVGALGVENIMKTTLLSKEELEDSLGFQLGEKCLLITFHPTTLQQGSETEHFPNLLDAISQIQGLRCIFTQANADPGGDVINRLIDTFVSNNPEQNLSISSLGMQRYLSAMKYAAVVVGNSSSGIIESPSFSTPTVDIGDRQKGRTRAASVINCQPKTDAIRQSLTKALSKEFRKSIKGVINPYAKDDTAQTIKNFIKQTDLRGITCKEFVDMRTDHDS